MKNKVKKAIAAASVAACFCGAMTGCATIQDILPDEAKAWMEDVNLSIIPPKLDISDFPTAEPTTKNTCPNTNAKNYDDLPTSGEFPGVIGEFEFSNKLFENDFGDMEYGTWASINCVGQDQKKRKEIVHAFEEKYGFAPTAYVVEDFLGCFDIEGYDIPVPVYQYYILDTTYWYDDRMPYHVYSKVSEDGHVWVGFSVYGTMDDYIANEETDQRIMDCKTEAYDLFEKLLGKPVSQMKKCKNQDSMGILTGGIVQSGKGRLEGHEGLTEIVYIVYMGTICNGPCCNPGVE